MKDGYVLGLDVWLEWRCPQCNYRQQMVDGEEWQEHCDGLMKMQPVRKFVVLQDSPTAGEGK